MFYFRINRLKIIDNREKRQFLRVFGSDRAEVKLNSFITTDETQLPDMDELLATTDPRRTKALFKAAVEHVVSSRVFTTIQNVTDNHEMTFGDTGYVLYQTETIPDNFNWILLAIETDADVREVGKELNSVIEDREFDSFVANTLAVAAAASNPSYVAAVGIGKYVVKMLAERRENNKDDMIGVLYTSLNRHEHYPHGERKRDNVPDLTNNMFIDYSMFGCSRNYLWWLELSSRHAGSGLFFGRLIGTTRWMRPGN